MEHFFSYLNHLNPLLIYAALTAGILLEGEITLIFSGILVRNKIIDYADILLIAFVAVVLHDIFYWRLGKYIFNKCSGDGSKGKICGVSKTKIETVLSHLKNSGGFYIIVSKFAWGLNRFVLIASGYYKTKFKDFFKYSVAATIIWSMSLISLGYIFAEKAKALKKDLRLFAIALTLVFALVLFIENRVRKAIAKKAQIREEDL